MTKNIEIGKTDYFTTSENSQINWDKFEFLVRTVADELDCILADVIDAENNLIIDCDKFDTIQMLNRSFFGAWTDSSWSVVRVLGFERTMLILERLSYKRYAFWDYEDNKNFEALDDALTIYRGGDGNKDEVLKGFSWSLSLEVAIEFSEKFSNGLVLCAEINKNDVILINAVQSELVPRPNSLRNIAVVENENTVVPPPMTV